MEKWQQQVMLEGKWIELATFPNRQVDRVVGTCNYIVKYIESSAEEAWNHVSNVIRSLNIALYLLHSS